MSTAIMSGTNHRSSQRSFAGTVPLSETPLISEDSALLLVDQALERDGVLEGATREVVRRALAALEVHGVLARDEARGLCALVPPP